MGYGGSRGMATKGRSKGVAYGKGIQKYAAAPRKGSSKGYGRKGAPADDRRKGGVIRTIGGKSRGKSQVPVRSYKGSGKSYGGKSYGRVATKGKTYGGKGKGRPGGKGKQQKLVKGKGKGKGKVKGKVKGKGKGKRMGVKGKGRGKGKGDSVSKEFLDKQLEAYMGPDAVKMMLDQELDLYFNDKKALETASAEQASTTENGKEAKPAAPAAAAEKKEAAPKAKAK